MSESLVALTEGQEVYLWDGSDRRVGTAHEVRPGPSGLVLFTLHLVLMHGDYDLPCWIREDGKGTTLSGHRKVQAVESARRSGDQSTWRDAQAGGRP